MLEVEALKGIRGERTSVPMITDDVSLEKGMVSKFNGYTANSMEIATNQGMINSQQQK